MAPVLSPEFLLVAPRVSRGGGRAIIWLAGEHDISTLVQLTDALERAISADHRDVVVDLSGVTFMSTATIDELLRAAAILQRQFRSLTLQSPSRFSRRLLELCGVTHLIAPRGSAVR